MRHAPDPPPEVGASPSRGAETGSATAVVFADDFRARLVLRGLLLTHQVRLEGEADTPGRIVDLVRRVRPTHLLLDPSSGEESVFQLISQARAIVPSMKIVLIRPAALGYSPPPDPAHRPDALLRDPFTPLEFAQALFSGGFERLNLRPVDTASTA